MAAGFTLLSGVMYKFACHAAHLADRDPFTPKMAFPIAAVLHASSSLEAFLNEEIEQRWTIDPNLKSSIRAVERIEFHHRWFIVPKLLFNRTFDQHAEPFQSFKALVKLRNELVHYKPVTRTPDFLPSFARDLESRFTFSAAEDTPGFPPVQLSWDQKILNRDCARWACGVARRMVLGWYELAGEDSSAADWQWSLSYVDGNPPGDPPASIHSVAVVPNQIGSVDLSKLGSPEEA